MIEDARGAIPNVKNHKSRFRGVASDPRIFASKLVLDPMNVRGIIASMLPINSMTMQYPKKQKKF